MKKIFKITGVILAIFIILFIVLAIWGMNDSKKEEVLAKSNINNEISFEGDKTIEPKQTVANIDSEWYKKFFLYENSEKQNKLELIWHDDAVINIAINDTSRYYFNSQRYEITADGNALYTCDDGTEFLYYPNNNSVEIKSGEYKGLYLFTDDTSSTANTIINDDFSYAENIALNYAVNSKTLYNAINNGHYDDYYVSDDVGLVDNVVVNNISIIFWFKNEKGFSSSAIVMFHVSGGEAIPYAISEGSSTWTDNLNERIEKLIDKLTN